MGFYKKYKVLITLSVVESINFSVGKLMVTNLPTFLYLSVRYFLMSMVGLCISIVNKEKRKDLVSNLKIVNTDRKSLMYGIISGVMYGITVFLYYKAFVILPLTFTIVLENVIRTVLGATLGYIFLKEYINRKIIVYMALVLTGTYFVVGLDMEGFKDIPNIELGITYLLISNTILCIDNVFMAKMSPNITNSFLITIKNILTTLIVVLAFVLSNEKFSDFNVDMGLWLAIGFIYTIIGGYYIRYANVVAVRDIGVQETTLFRNFSTVLSVFVAMLIFGTWFTILQWLGFIIVCIFIYLITNEKNKNKIG